MNNFKEAFRDDLHAFFDEEEFADRHTIDGEECIIILTDVAAGTAAPAGKKYPLNPKETAINRVSHIIYIRDMEAEKLKRVKFSSGAMINLDGKKYFIQDVEHLRGMFRLEIGIHTVKGVGL